MLLGSPTLVHMTKNKNCLTIPCCTLLWHTKELKKKAEIMNVKEGGI